MQEYEPYVSIGVAMGSGLIIGLEREQSAPRIEEQAGPMGGARTYPLAALAGALSMMVARQIGGWFVGVALASLTGFTLLAYRDDLTKGRDRGITSEIAFLVTFLLGAMTTSDVVIRDPERRLIVVPAIAVIVTALLSLKGTIHGFAAKISRSDVFSTVKFLVVLLIVLPQLPNQGYGPYQVLNPFSIGSMIVLIAGMGFVGYVLVRMLGAGRGLGLMGFIGGIVSSTAVTLSMAARARRDPTVVRSCALAIVLASTIMFVRVGVEVWVVYRPLLGSLVYPLGAMLVAGAVAAGVLYLRSRAAGARSEEELAVTNPFDLGSAIKFGLLFAVVLVGAHAANDLFGQRGVYVAAVLAGATDVDAIVLSTAKLAEGGLAGNVAATAIVLAALANTVVKGVMALVLGGAALGRLVLVAQLAMAATGAAGLVVLWVVA